MNFEWDEEKRLTNIRKHGFDFRDAQDLLEGAHVVIPSRYQGQEPRLLATGLLQGRFVTVVYTMRDETFRIISMRSARDEEGQRYQALHR